ncbi:hypothetical protein [Pseudovibrio ascidiaceicola]|uniref:hypothetical protein n=1 Tax=Pseudovibrio ascidiaceicola TaxID=285279 RepID=UPI000D69A39E|nr:hypothetical protein [Pseudovibrio ascidiaceicola]
MTGTSESNFGLCGHVYIDVSRPEKQGMFEKARVTLEAAGWKTEGSTAHFQVVRQGEEVDGQTVVVCCVTEPEKLGKFAIEPDAYEVLRALGGCEIEEALCASVSSDVVIDKVVVGLNWTMVRAGELCGI